MGYAESVKLGKGNQVASATSSKKGSSNVVSAISSHKRPVSDDAEVMKAEIEALVSKAQDGDVDSFAVVYDHFVDKIYRYVYYRVPKEDVEDITEMVFLKAWEKLKQYKSGRKSFSAWIFRIAHNLVVDTYRFKKDKEFVELSPNVPEHRREHNPIKVTENSLHSDKLKTAISKIKKNYRQIVVLKFINELSNVEIAQVLNKSEGSVRILQFRALKALKKELEDMGVEGV